MAARLFCDPPPPLQRWPELCQESARTLRPVRTLTVTAVGWWRRLSRACSLLAWVAKWILPFLSLRFFGGQSLTLLYLSDVASWWVFITPNCFCAAGISSSPAPTLTHRYTAKTLKKILYCWPFVAGSYSFPPAVCAAPETQHSLSVSVVFPVCRSRVECCEPLCARDLDDRHMDFLLFRSLKTIHWSRILFVLFPFYVSLKSGEYAVCCRMTSSLNLYYYY